MIKVLKYLFSLSHLCITLISFLSFHRNLDFWTPYWVPLIDKEIKLLHTYNTI
jgi:hypothetical protein